MQPWGHTETGYRKRQTERQKISSYYCHFHGHYGERQTTELGCQKMKRSEMIWKRQWSKRWFNTLVAKMSLNVRDKTGMPFVVPNV